MFKMIGGVLIGVFVGAALYEFLHRRSPHLLHDIEQKAKRSVRSAVDAFNQGYAKPERGQRSAG